MNLFEKAMKEYNQNNPAPRKNEEKICHANNFYDAMKAYIHNKKPKEICLHARTMKSKGWETCSDCRLRLSRIFHDNPYSNVAGYITKPKEDSLPKIRETMTEAINSVTRKKVWLSYSRYGWDEPLKNGLPPELMDHWNELCLKCMDLEEKVECHKHSLCAAVLWEKVKSSYPGMMTLTEFSEKVDVSMPTIIKTLKKIKENDRDAKIVCGNT